MSSFLSDADSIVLSNAPTTIKQFITQRKRHLSGAKHFPLSVQFKFTMYFLSRLFLLVSIIGIAAVDINCLSSFFFFPYGLHLIILYLEANRMGQKRIILLYPLWEFYYLVNQLFLAPLSFLTESSWGTR